MLMDIFLIPLPESTHGVVLEVRPDNREVIVEMILIYDILDKIKMFTIRFAFRTHDVDRGNSFKSVIGSHIEAFLCIGTAFAVCGVVLYDAFVYFLYL